MAGSFAVAVTCIDGRRHEPLVRWVREHVGVDHVDLVTQPGADLTLSTCPRIVCDTIDERLRVSMSAHAPRAVVIAGHGDCAANPAPEPAQRRHVADAVREGERWGLDLPVIGVWIDVDGAVETIAGAATAL